LEKSKSRRRPSGRVIAYPKMQGRILGHSDIVTDLIFVCIQTLSFEQRKSTKFRLNRGDALTISDVNSTESDCASVCRGENLLPNGTSQRVNHYCTKITVVILRCHMIW
jgi:hypothetical protein